jgi:hypothetical protein
MFIKQTAVPICPIVRQKYESKNPVMLAVFQSLALGKPLMEKIAVPSVTGL